jgi:hypothetical protein
MRPLVTVGAETAHINLALADVGGGEELEVPADGEAAAVILTGVVDAFADDMPLGREGREMIPYFDPAHAWVQNGR